MAHKELYAWTSDGVCVGVFRSVSNSSAKYRVITPGIRISNSLPMEPGSRASGGKVYSFLDNLLPETGVARLRMQESKRVQSDNVFDLLSSEDTVGGLVFTSGYEKPPMGIPAYQSISTAEIAARIEDIESNPDSWFFDYNDVRFSLAGVQGKFTLSRLNGGWYRPNITVPSTTILKPESAPNSIEIEYAMMNLAKDCGLEVPEVRILNFNDKKVYAIRRFDRGVEKGRLVRYRAEDFLQALGKAKEEKYDVTVQDCLKMLADLDSTLHLGYSWLRQLFFNVVVGNCDAHAKNYSLIYKGGSVVLAPLYDVMCTRLYRNVKPYLAMSIGSARRTEDVVGEDISNMLTGSGLPYNETRVRGICEDVLNAVGNNLYKLQGYAPHVGNSLIHTISGINEF